MDELLALLERYAPGYCDGLQGADDWYVDKLEEVFGRPLPGFYREFAQVMGTQGGPLLAEVHSYEPFHIADLYRVAAMEMPPRRFLYVFGDPSPDAQHYWLDLDAPREDGDGDCHVVRLPFGEESWRTQLLLSFVSMREMLFMWAMWNVMLPDFSQQAAYVRGSQRKAFEGGGISDAEELARVFERMGFARLPYPQRCLLFEREDAAIGLYRRPDSPGFSFRVGMREPGEFRRFQAIVEDLEGLERW